MKGSHHNSKNINQNNILETIVKYAHKSYLQKYKITKKFPFPQLGDSLFLKQNIFQNVFFWVFIIFPILNCQFATIWMTLKFFFNCNIFFQAATHGGRLANSSVMMSGSSNDE